ncbi:hypothetical protein C8A03DRAFT_46961 [Achaetomium macrosporum]|uniref:Uncharacterized protein n=1 Tax=Achaetomium macrosporum TaxID=79813 RepID=A0AAN7H859_9PEZI|nr:hypothetical protein C8A03DRAFT_46961 [Achaetomium macrosporum]
MPWKSLLSSVGRVSRCIPKLGLAPWDMLSPHVQERFGQWTPDAKRLWESDFGWHREALVRAWIWHYLDDNIFSFSPSAGAGELVKCSSPVWEHVRLLWQDLDVLRTRDGVFRDFLYIHEPLYRIQFHAWRRLTESLVRRGLGVEHFVNAADLVPHFKRSLRQLLADGETKLPDHPKDTKNWRPLIELEWAGTMIDWLHINIRSFLREARDVQYYIHGMIGTYALRFSPIGSDKLWGFPFDEKCMQDFSPPDIPRIRPGEALLPPVKLVSDPMLVVSGTNGRGIEADFTVRTRMQVVAPWTYGGEEADRHRFPGLEKGWEERDIKEVEERIAKEQKDAEVGEGSKQHDLLCSSHQQQTRRTSPADSIIPCPCRRVEP